jgi:ATP-dependent RNA helicase DDX10/DBP4
MVRAIIAPLSDDDGYVSPDFDLPDLPSNEEEDNAPPSKRSKIWNQHKESFSAENTIEDDEELALQLLRKR